MGRLIRFFEWLAVSFVALALAVVLTDRFAGVAVNAEHGTVSFSFWPWVVSALVVTGVVSGVLAALSLAPRK